MAPHLSRDGAASDPARRQADGSAAHAAPSTVRLCLEAEAQHHFSPAARRRSMAEAAGMLDDVRRRIGRDPEGARAAALRLVALLARREAASRRRCVEAWRRGKSRRSIFTSGRGWSGRCREELAEQASLSVSHFCRAFKESFGASPHLHLTRLRVERAQRLMLATQDPLSQIALACGMADQAHLSKLFRREVGEPPSTWRRRNRTGAEAPGTAAGGSTMPSTRLTACERHPSRETERRTSGAALATDAAVIGGRPGIGRQPARCGAKQQHGERCEAQQKDHARPSALRTARRHLGTGSCRARGPW
jgi:AraC-like DNA-binding protein